MNLLPDKTWGPVTVISVLLVVFVAIVGAVSVLRDNLSIEAYVAALTAISTGGFVARGIWGRSDEPAGGEGG